MLKSSTKIKEISAYAKIVKRVEDHIYIYIYTTCIVGVFCLLYLEGYH